MVLTDTFLTQVAKALANESYTVSSHLAVTTATDFSADVTATDIGTEIGSREAVATTRVDNVTTYSATRSGASVVGASGDTLTGVGLFSASSGGDLEMLVPLPSLSHTTGFDIEFDFQITAGRR